jgi:hypothetical protein
MGIVSVRRHVCRESAHHIIGGYGLNFVAGSQRGRGDSWYGRPVGSESEGNLWLNILKVYVGL